MRILIVEDNQTVGRTLRRRMERRGHEAVWVESGEAALERLADGTWRADRYVLDLRLPGMSRVELLDRLLKLEPPVAAGQLFVVSVGAEQHRVELEARRVPSGQILQKGTYSEGELLVALRLVDPPRGQGSD